MADVIDFLERMGQDSWWRLSNRRLESLVVM
jgi:hypothetical protein